MNAEQYKVNVIKVIKGVKVLFIRQIAIQGISLIVNIILARLLMPEDFGIFAIINFFIAFLAIFCDSGLSASLIQKKGSLTDNDIATTFTIQFFLSVVLAGITYFSADRLTIIYDSLTENEIRMMRVLAITLIVASLRTIPMAMLLPQIGILVIFSLILVPTGFISFNYALKKAKKDGSLIQY